MGLASLGLPPEVLAGFQRYRADLLRFNRGQNLVSRAGGSDQLDSLLLECAAASRLLGDALRILDLGSGAGLPGLPVALVRDDVSMTLLERRGGRCDFLRRETAALDLSHVQVLERDAADVDPNHAEAYDAVLLKAVAPPREALALARPYLAPSGRAILFRDLGWIPSAEEREGWSYHGPESSGPVSGLSDPAVVHIFSVA